MTKSITITVLIIILAQIVYLNTSIRKDFDSSGINHSPGSSLVLEKENLLGQGTDSIFKDETNKKTKLAFFSEEEVDSLLEDMWKKNPIVDGLLEPHKNGVNFTSEIAIPTQTNVFSGKLKITSKKNPYFEHTKDTYERYNYKTSNNVNFVKNARDISCKYNTDIIPEFIHYQQKPWATSIFNTGFNSNKLENIFKEWINTVSIMIQPYYSKSSNEDLYWQDQHYAGGQHRFPDNGLTKKGEVLVKSYAKHGGLLDASHVKNKTFEDMISISEDLKELNGLPVPIFLNHANIDASGTAFPAYLENKPANYSRNKTPHEICLSAKSGGIWGVMPVKVYVDAVTENADFYDLADQIYFMKNYTCRERSFGGLIFSMRDFKDDLINMIDHISVASDANINYFDKNDPTESMFYLDEDSADPLKWKKLAKYLLLHDFNNDGYRDFTLDDIKKIFGLNAIRSYARGLDGALPFGQNFCALSGRKIFYMGNFLNTDKNDFAIANNTNLIISKSHLKGHFDGPSLSIKQESWCLENGQQSVSGDFNGDGYDDFFCHSYESGISKLIYNLRGEGFDKSRIHLMRPCGKTGRGRLYSGDTNGDGKDEIICHNELGEIYKTPITKKIVTKKLEKNFCRKKTSIFAIIDLDNDKKDDFYCHFPNGRHIKKLQKKHNNLLRPFNYIVSKPWCKITDKLRIYFGDFDGDGKGDRLCHSLVNGRLWIDYGVNKFKGTDWSNLNMKFCNKSNESIIVSDTSGDNQDDVHCYDQYTGYLYSLRGSDEGLNRAKSFQID